MKGKLSTFLLAFFFGGQGAHRFYTGRLWSGVVWLLTGGIFGVGSLVDLFFIASDRYTDSDGDELDNDCSPILCWVLLGLRILGFISALFLTIFAMLTLVNMASQYKPGDLVQEEEYSQTVEYEYMSLSEMLNDLTLDADAAEQTYMHETIEVSGVIKGFSDEGLFITIIPEDESSNYVTEMTCYITNEYQTDVVLGMEPGDTVTVSGEIVGVMNAFGYDLDIHNIVLS